MSLRKTLKRSDLNKALSHFAIFRETCLATPLREKSHETLHSVTYLATAENVARQAAKTVAESRTRNDFKQLSASLRSHTSPLPSVHACAMFRATHNALRDKLHEKVQCDSVFRQLLYYCSAL